MSDDETIKTPDGSRGSARFSTTHWTLVMRARDQHSDGADQALESLCSTYWYPLYAFLRRAGNSPEDAQDLTQDFFQQLLGKGRLTAVDPAKGKFRSFLLASIKNLANTEWKRANAQKRGGGIQLVSIDADPETRYLREPSHSDTPEKLYEQRWAQTLVARALDRTKDECEAQGKPFEELKAFLVDARGAAPYAETASRLGVSEGALKSSIHRLRKRYGEIFREEVAATVSTPEEVDEELQWLLEALGRQ
ncbi:MAG: RNA polymerase sigma factor (sigma-70 family) [Verrucomicrobiales bacterium]|jgi:RNA polymerase sigma factor (sigma-70 family)